MRQMLLSTLVLAILMPSAVHGQKKSPKVDSLLIVLPMSKDATSDAVVEAFTAAGLTVSDQTPSMIESDVGTTKDGLGSYSHQRTVRATLLPRKDSTAVLIVGTEALTRRNQEEARKRIDNKAQGNGGRVWRQILDAGKRLDSTQVSPDAAWYQFSTGTGKRTRRP